MWSQASNLWLDLEDLRRHDPKLTEEFYRNTRELTQASFRDPSQPPLTELEEQAYRRAAGKHVQLVSRVRSLPGFSRFLLPPLIAELQQAASGGDVVVINASRFRCDALIIRSNMQLELAPLPGVTLDTVEHLVADFLVQVNEFEEGRLTSISDLFHQTWSLFGGSTIKHLAYGSPSLPPRLWWCMTGSLTFIPTHACFPKPVRSRKTQGQGMMDLAVSSCTTTLSALVRHLRNDKSPPLSILAVAQPDGGCEGGPLPCASSEVEIVRGLSMLHTSILVGPNATVDTVADVLASATWVHFACHGVQNVNQPMNSAFMMYDNHLTLARIAQSSSRSAQFAYLSACQSAKGSKTLPNESLHISASLYFEGFRSVIGTMWSINDNDSLVVANEFYRQLLKNDATAPQESDTVHALHRAVQYLRKAKGVPACSGLHSFI
jgi:CHAT domain